jgi:hypothetical protein
MIYEVLQTLTDNLNIYFRTKLKIQEDKAELSAIVNQDGTIALQSENKVLVTLLNVEREPYSASGQIIGRQKLSLNLMVIFSCHFSNSNYSEAIRFLDLIITYFEENYTLEAQNIYDGNNKIKIEIETYNIDKVHNIWATIGAKYLPSVVYKLRMVVVDSNSISTFTPAVNSAPEVANFESDKKTTTTPVADQNTKNNAFNNLEEIDKELAESGLSTDTSKLNDPNTLSQLNNLDNIK